MSRSLRLLSSLLSTLLLAVLGLAAGTPASAQETPATKPVFGAQFHGMWSSYDDASRARYLDQLAASGATWARLDVSWRMLQPTSRDAYDLRWGVPFVDRVIGMMRARGLKPLVTLWQTPAWANGGAGERALPTDPQDYARMAAWAAQRWSGQVEAWEIWNEPNHPHYMTGADPVAYTRLLKAAYPAIKQASPNAKVVFGGPSLNDTPWLTKAYAAGAAGSFDVMATHPYQAMADEAPELPDNGTKYRFTHLAAVHRLMVANGDGAKPIWATEFGWSSHPNDGTEANWERGVTPEQQGDYLVRALKLAAATMPYVTHLFWYTDRDMAGEGTQNGNYGLVRADLSPKPVLQAVSAYYAASAPAPVAPAPAPVVQPTVAPTVAPTTAPTVTAEPVVAPVVTVTAEPVVTVTAAPVVTVTAAPTTTTKKPLRRRSLTGTGTTIRKTDRLSMLQAALRTAP